MTTTIIIQEVGKLIIIGGIIISVAIVFWKTSSGILNVLAIVLERYVLKSQVTKLQEDTLKKIEKIEEMGIEVDKEIPKNQQRKSYYGLR